LGDPRPDGVRRRAQRLRRRGAVEAPRPCAAEKVHWTFSETPLTPRHAGRVPAARRGRFTPTSGRSPPVPPEPREREALGEAAVIGAGVTSCAVMAGGYGRGLRWCLSSDPDRSRPIAAARRRMTWRPSGASRAPRAAAPSRAELVPPSDRDQRGSGGASPRSVACSASGGRGGLRLDRRLVIGPRLPGRAQKRACQGAGRRGPICRRTDWARTGDARPCFRGGRVERLELMLEARTDTPPGPLPSWHRA
jgi:hypothetical protein